MTATSTTTLAAIASSHPSMTRELERLGIDYCCGGQRTLEQACQQQGLDPEAVLAELNNHPHTEQPPAGWLGLTPAELADHLENAHHRYLKTELPRLSELATKVSRVHGRKHPELIRVAEICGEICSDLELHLRKEEEVLFPMIRVLAATGHRPALHCGSIADPIKLMD